MEGTEGTQAGVGMKVKDKNIGKLVSVCCKNCPNYKCYWPRQNPGSFVTGRGYRSYGDGRDKEYLCGTRNAHGCPENPELC